MPERRQKQMVVADEIAGLRRVQTECAESYKAAQSDKERDWHMLGIADYVMEEVLIICGSLD